jgi:hypothetical protein
MPNHFLHPGNLKKRLGRICLIDVLSRRLALRTHNLTSGHLKNEFGEVDEEMFQGVERPCELIFYVLGIERSELDVFD